MKPSPSLRRSQLRPWIVGALLLVVACATVRSAARAREVPPWPGRVRAWVVHFDGQTMEIGATAFRSLVAGTPRGVPFHVALAPSTDEGAFRRAMRLSPANAARLRFLKAGTGLSAWARDRYVIFERQGLPVILVPDTAAVTPHWRGDLGIAERLAAATEDCTLLRTGLALEGGDLILGRKIALVGAGTIAANRAHAGLEPEAVVAELEHLLERRVLVVDTGDVPAPHAHIDMAVHLLDDRTALVGDPRLALALWPRVVATTDGRAALEAYASPTREEQQAAVASYEAVVQSLQKHGLHVKRIPAVHSDGGDLVLSWTNAVTDVVAGARRVYVPAYGLGPLDAAAHAVWRGLGYRVVPIDAGSAALEGGAVRCLTNVFRTRAPRLEAPVAAGGQPAVGARR